MTESEALEAIAAFSANAMTAFTVYISFTFAYLVTAYYAGLKLTTFQSLAVSSLYLVGTGSAFLAMIAYLDTHFKIIRQVQTVLDNHPLYSAVLWIPYMTTVSVGGIIVSLYFMWSIRHPKKE